jgi:hypothetical protein
MRFRKLRIAWSVGCAIACVLLIVLWVRSYYAPFVFHLKPTALWFLSIGGHIGPLVTETNKDGTMHMTTYHTAPYLALVFLAATVGAFAWIPQRFTLRTLIIATTLVAVVLGLIVWASK